MRTFWGTRAPQVNTKHQEFACHYASQERHRFLHFYQVSLCARLSPPLSDALMLGLLTEHNGSNPLFIRLSSPHSLSLSLLFLISLLLPLNLLVFSSHLSSFSHCHQGFF